MITQISQWWECKSIVDINLFFDFLMDRIQDKNTVSEDISDEVIGPITSIFAQISLNPLDSREAQTYFALTGKPYSHIQKTTILNTYYNAILTFAMARYNSNTIPQLYFTIAEMMILNGMNTYRYLAFAFYLQMMGRVPEEYIRPNYSLIVAGSIQGVDADILKTLGGTTVRRPDLPEDVQPEPKPALQKVKIDTGSQSVHGKHVTQHVQEALHQLFEVYKYPPGTNERTLFETYFKEYSERLHGFSSLLSRFFSFFTRTPKPTRRNVTKINKVLSHIRTDKTTFTAYKTNKRYTLDQVFTKVYFIVKSLPADLISDGLTRLDEELEEATGMCGVGHLNRLINVLSGFDVIKIRSKEECKAEIYNKMLRLVQAGMENEKDEKQKDIYETYIGAKEHVAEFKPLIDANIDGWCKDVHRDYSTVLKLPETKRMIYDALIKIGIYANVAEPAQYI
jgi:hypothetical protein